MGYYLLEIGAEELPAKFVVIALEYLKNQAESLLKGEFVKFGSIESSGTPRRLYLFIDKLEEFQDISVSEILGPPASVAFDAQGNLTKTGLGFIKSKGIQEKDIKVVDGPKGKYLSGVKCGKASPTSEILKKKIGDLILSIPFPKTMKWDTSNIRFARPIHWILSLYNGTHLPIKIGKIESGTYTFGHRFLNPNRIDVDNYKDYIEKLRKSFVIVNIDERKQLIKEYLKKIVDNKDLAFIYDEDLLNTIVNLVELPYPVVSCFDKSFLELPEEVLITSLKNHQKFFYLKDNAGKITTFFVGISNTKPWTNDTFIENGYSKVIKARLSDALFFYRNDQKIPLINRLEKLKHVIFQERLGTLYDKTERLFKLSKFILDDFKLDDLKEAVEKAAQLSKCDLTTEMVAEFPELQGVMGMIYANIEGKPKNIAKTIYEHYLPRFAGDELPTTLEGSILSLADKIDTIAGNFAGSNIPTGNIDPYGLRRKAIGIIEILEYKQLNADIKKLVNKALSLYEGLIATTHSDTSVSIINFIKQRLKQKLIAENISPDSFDAVSNKYNGILSIKMAAKAINDLKNSDNFRTIASSYKRINNILSKNNWMKCDYNVDLLLEAHEKDLHELINRYRSLFAMLIEENNFREALYKLLDFSKPLSLFFDNVLVMVEDNNIRNNRLSLLKALKDTCDDICDLSKLIY